MASQKIRRDGGVLKLIGIMEAGTGDKMERAKVGVLAGALAEDLCKRFKDKIDPSAAARAAEEAHRELVAEMTALPGEEAPREKTFQHGRFKID